MDPLSLLERPATDVSRLIAGDLLERASTAARRLDKDDPEALHDFRVALRRLRTHQKAYQDVLGRAATKKLRKRLKKIARATNASRDVEVGREWLAKNRT